MQASMFLFLKRIVNVELMCGNLIVLTGSQGTLGSTSFKFLSFVLQLLVGSRPRFAGALLPQARIPRLS